MNGLMAIKRYAAGGITFPDGFTSLSGPYKAEYYNNLRKDYSESDILKAAEKQFGTIPADQWDMLTSYADTVKTLERVYQDLFNRPLDPEGRDYWTQVTEGRPASEIYQLVANAAQAEDRTKLDPDEAAKASVKSIFAEQLGRQPTAAELTQYVAFINDGRSTADISRELDRSLEGYNFDAEKIEADYRNLFGRTADQEGFQYWMSTEDASAGKVSANKLNSYIEGGAKGTDVAALADRPEVGYGVETPLSLSSLIADPYGGRYATELPYLSQAETDALFPGSGSEGSAYAAAEGQIGLPQYYMNIRNWFRDNPNATSAQVNAEAQKWGVSDADIRAALNPEIGLVSKTLAGDLLKFTTPVTEQPVQSWFDDKGQFSAQAGPNVLQREDVDAAINRALDSGAINQTQVNQLNQDLNQAKTWSEAYEALNKPKANVVLNELGVQVGEDVDANTALQEANARKQLADAASNLIGGGYPSAVLQGQLAPDMKIDYPFSAEKMQAGYEGTTTKKGLADIFKNLGTELKFADMAYQQPKSAANYLRSTDATGGIGALRPVSPENINFANLAPQLRFATPQRNLITEAARPSVETAFRTLDQGTQKFGDRQAPLGAGQMSRGLRTAFEIGLGPSQYYENIRTFLEGNPNADAIAAAKEQYGVSDVDIQRALGETRAMRFAAPMTTQQKMRSYVGDVTAPDATLKGLQFVRNLGLDPAQATTLWNQTYGTNFNLDDYKRVMGEYGGLFGPAFERAPANVSTVSGAAGNDTVGGGFTSVYGNTYSYPTGLSEDQVRALNAANVPPPGGDFTNYLLPPINYSDAPFSNLRTPDIGFIPMGGNLVEDWGDREQGTPATPGEIGSDILDFLNPFGDKKDDEAPPEAPETTDKYAGGPVTGSPQYFEEGGKVEPMRKYTPAELGSTFDVSEYIDPETGRFMINEYRRDVIFGKGLEEAETEARARMTPEEREMAMRDLMIRQGRTGREYGLPGITVGGPATSGIRPLNYYAEGGEAKGLGGIAMRGVAQEMRSAGRYGDTVLAHINPEEARILSQISGPPSINPETGLPEFFWKKLFGVVSKVLPFIPIPGLFGMSSLLTKSILSGLAAGASAKKGFDLKQALGGGLTAYALGSLGEKMGIGGGQAQAQAVDGSSMLAADGTTIGANALSPMELAEQQGGYGFGPQSVAPTPLVEAGSLTGTAVNPTVDMPTPTPNYGTYIDGGISTDARPTIAPEATTGLTTDLYTQGPGIGQPLQGTDIVMAGVGGLGLESAAKETRDQQMALAAAEEERKKKIERYNALARYYGSNIAFQPRTARTGGLMALAGGGAIDPVGYEGGGMTAPVNQPRMLAGGGDGMSDSIPATIDGTQPARLADGEFVIPADVVADIGNGSSSAGAKRLYGMMDRVREARHGTTKQPPEIKMNRLMPA